MDDMTYVKIQKELSKFKDTSFARSASEQYDQVQNIAKSMLKSDRSLDIVISKLHYRYDNQIARDSSDKKVKRFNKAVSEMLVLLEMLQRKYT